MNEDVDIVRLERRGRVAILTLDRPPVNALSLSLYKAIEARIDQINSDEEIYTVIFTAAGKVFCAGADIKEMIQLTPETRRSRHELANHLWFKLATVLVPVICAMRGSAIGGGAAIGSLCDYRIASDDATFSYPEIERGTTAGGGIFLRKIGVSAGIVRKLLYTGRSYTAREALELGLIDEVVPNDRLMPSALALAEEIATRSRAALIGMKKAIIAAEAEADWFAAYRATHEFSSAAMTDPYPKDQMKAFLDGASKR